MALALKDVRRIASEVAQQQNPALEVISATSADGGSGYAEVMLTVRGCRAEPCRVMIGVSRNASEAELRQAVADRLRAHAAEHQPVAPR
jgi:glycerate kinase